MIHVEAPTFSGNWRWSVFKPVVRPRCPGVGLPTRPILDTRSCSATGTCTVDGRCHEIDAVQRRRPLSWPDAPSSIDHDVSYGKRL